MFPFLAFCGVFRHRHIMLDVENLIHPVEMNTLSFWMTLFKGMSRTFEASGRSSQLNPPVTLVTTSTSTFGCNCTVIHEDTRRYQQLCRIQNEVRVRNSVTRTSSEA